jgi:hypothetical protein
MSNEQQAFSRSGVPNWGLEAMRIMDETHRMADDIETELRYAARLNGLDPRLQDKVQAVRDAVGVLKLSLSVLEYTTEQVLSERLLAEVPETGSAPVR